MADKPVRILLDWGTSSLRAYLMADDGIVLDDKASGDGVANVEDRQFEPILRRITEGWIDQHGRLPIYAFGMIGSRNGWVEMPYARCPAQARDIAALMETRALDDGLTIVFAPGLNCPSGDRAPDVIRGEEVHLFGLPAAEATIAVLPGTHSKWARLEGGVVIGFQTFVTGELYGLLSTHSFVAPATGNGTQFNTEIFERGLAAARSDETAHGGLLARLFGVRTNMLAGRLAPEKAGDYLSGLLIGTEFREALAAEWVSPGGTVTLLGSGELIDRYARASTAFGLSTEIAGADVMISGADSIAQDYEAL